MMLVFLLVMLFMMDVVVGDNFGAVGVVIVVVVVVVAFVGFGK